MKTYIGCKIIKAEPMDDLSFLQKVKGQLTLPPSRFARPGYFVEYPDGYKSWSPKDVFEGAYRGVTEAEKKLI